MVESTDDLKYGHPGQATYSSENKAWSFQRRPGIRGGLLQLGSWKTVIQPAARSANVSGSRTRMKTIEEAARALTRCVPELQPALELLPTLALSSTVVLASTEAYSPSIGTLLDFGSLATGERRTRLRRIAALPTGALGNTLLLTVVALEKNGWENMVFVEGPAIADRESGYWAEDAAPIQQVCFAQVEDTSTLLAVRLPTKTVFFRPRHVTHSSVVPNPHACHHTRSRLDPNPIATLDIENSGGIPHVDVAFCPDNQQWVGVVDQRGNWSVWEIDNNHKTTTPHHISPIATGMITLEHQASEHPVLFPEEKRQQAQAEERKGSLPEQEDSTVVESEQIDAMEEDKSPRSKKDVSRLGDDGWARILWVGSMETVLVCNRRTLRFVRIKQNKTTLLACPSPVPPHSADWILDIRNHPKNRDQCFLLTSTHLFLIGVSCLDDVHSAGSSDAGARILLSWTHFRGADDASLLMSAHSTSDEETMVILYSRLNHLITLFDFQEQGKNPSAPYSSSDPTQLDLTEDVYTLGQTARYISGLHIDQLQIGGDETVDQQGLNYRNSGVRFYRLSVLLSDLSVCQTLLYHLRPAEEDGKAVLLDVQPPTWSKVTNARLSSHRSKSINDISDNFIVPDTLETSTASALKARSAAPYSLQSRPKTSEPSIKQSYEEEQPHEDFQFVLDAMSGNEETTGSDGTNALKTKDVSQVYDQLKLLLDEDVGRENVGHMTAFEFADAKLKVSDLEQASSQLQELFDVIDYPNSLRFQNIASDQLACAIPHVEPKTTLALLYDMMLYAWMATLPASTSVRSRHTKEQVARRIAAEVVLANARVYHNPNQPFHDEDTTSSAPHSVRADIGSMSSSTAMAASSQSSISLPTAFDPSSSSFSSAAQATPFAGHPNPLVRLSQHLRISKPAPTVSPEVNEVLMHFSFGVHPNDYDWEAMTRAVDEKLDTGEIEVQKRERMKKKAEKLFKRQRRELDLERQRVERPVLGSDRVVPRTSPAPTVGMGMSSQITQTLNQGHGIPFRGIVQSQTEPGRHGGRLSRTKKGRKHISGF